ncbi:MAG: phosphoribosylformimino-5-aminoimidazole carboxamide ribotide isomerase [Lachnospiraceae bacterium]
MKFRPCIDIHNGAVKQIVGGTLTDQNNQAHTNYISAYEADFYAKLYQKDHLKGGHIILLNPPTSDYYEATNMQALKALKAYPGGMQIGGGITAENAPVYLEKGASHAIVTSYVFQNGEICWENLKKLERAVGKEHVVLDLSCRKKEDEYYIVTNRWQTFTKVGLTKKILQELSEYCDEFLIHGVDQEGKAAGVEHGLVRLLGTCELPGITYAGGIGTLADLERFREESGGIIDFTIGSALDLFGGKIPYEVVKKL